MADNTGSNKRPFTPENYPEKARVLLYEHLIKRPHGRHSVEGIELSQIYVVWFNFTLGNWKCLLSTTIPDGRYYEITHRVDSEMVFIDVYQKITNTAVNDIN